MLEDRHLQRVLELRRNARLGPIPDVGARYPAWVVDLWSEVNAALKGREA